MTLGTTAIVGRELGFDDVGSDDGDDLGLDVGLNDDG
jgi:hypothetical protein